MSEEKKILQTIQFFIESVLLENNTEKALQVISDNVLGVGMNEQGTICCKAELSALLRAQKRTSAVLEKISYPKSDIRYHPPGFATASVVYQLHFVDAGKSMTSAFIQTVAAKKEGKEWRLCLLQAVPVDFTAASIANYPLKFADNTLAKLKKDLQQDIDLLLNKSVSVGILGFYIDTKKLPPFYVNDSLLALFGGYTEEEFFLLIKENSFALVHPDDKQRVQDEIFSKTQLSSTYECQYRIIRKDGDIRWIVEHGRLSQRDGHDALLAAYVDITDVVKLQLEAENKNQVILSSIQYARRLQNNLLPPEYLFQDIFADYSILWSPKNIVGGDVYWLKTFEAGTVLCVCDCTGHSISGAMLTMLVSTTLDNIIQEWNCHNLPNIMFALDKRGSEILNAHAIELNGDSIMRIRDGCDLVLLFIAKDGSVTFASANMPVFLCNGQEVKQYKGQHLHIGEGRLLSPQEIKTVHCPASAANVFYIASDGLFDQIGGENTCPFGYHTFQELILKYYHTDQKTISNKIWEAFEQYRGEQIRRDDVELLSFRL